MNRRLFIAALFGAPTLKLISIPDPRLDISGIAIAMRQRQAEMYARQQEAEMYAAELLRANRHAEQLMRRWAKDDWEFLQRTAKPVRIIHPDGTRQDLVIGDKL